MDSSLSSSSAYFELDDSVEENFQSNNNNNKEKSNTSDDVTVIPPTPTTTDDDLTPHPKKTAARKTRVLQFSDDDDVDDGNEEKVASGNTVTLSDSTLSTHYVAEEHSTGYTSSSFVTSTPIPSIQRRQPLLRQFELGVTALREEDEDEPSHVNLTDSDHSDSDINDIFETDEKVSPLPYQNKQPLNERGGSKQQESSNTDQDSDIQVVEEFKAPERNEDVELVQLVKTLGDFNLNQPRIEKKVGPVAPQFFAVPTSSKVKPPSAEVLAYRGDVKKAISHLAEVVQTIPHQDARAERPSGLKVNLYDHQSYGLEWLSWREGHYPGGGILADEMGLGKTVMIISLILRSKASNTNSRQSKTDNFWVSASEKSKLVPSRSTLVVVPLSVMQQWYDEISSKAPRLEVYKFHGPKRTTSSAVLAQTDIILTTYTTVTSEFREPKGGHTKSPLQRVFWERIVLDEGHMIRNSGTNSAAAVSKLHAAHRWIVTGTPVHNRPADLHSLVRFLHLQPFDDEKVWDYWIGLKDVPHENQERLHIIGKALILRRTKAEVNSANGATIPAKSVKDVIVELTPEERQIYEKLQTFAEHQFKKFLKDREKKNVAKAFGRADFVGEGEVKFSHMLALLIRLRQLSVLPCLACGMLEDDDDTEDDLNEFDPMNENDVLSKRNPIFSDSYVSSKLKQLFIDINQIRQACETENRRMDKIIIVSQWSSLLKIVAKHLKMDGYSFDAISGEVPSDVRNDVMTRFNKSSRPQMLLLSLMAGGVGLNLVGGSHMIFLDPHYNPQLELQCQDRIHRFGQTKPVFIIRYVSQGTIEERVCELQQKKLELADGLMNNKSGGGLTIANMRRLFGL